MVFFIQHLCDMISTFCRLSRGPGLGIIRRGSALLEWTLLTLPGAAQPGGPGATQNPSRTAGQAGQAAVGCGPGQDTGGQREALQDQARSSGQLLWQLYLASADHVSPIQTSISGERAP